MVRIVVSTVEVITPDGIKSLWAVALPHREAVAAVRKVIPPDHIAELSILRSLHSSAKLRGLRPGEVRKIGVLTKPDRKIRPNIAESINGGPKREPPVSTRAVSDYRAYPLGREDVDSVVTSQVIRGVGAPVNDAALIRRAVKEELVEYFANPHGCGIALSQSERSYIASGILARLSRSQAVAGKG
jgi:hypothetical protein